MNLKNDSRQDAKPPRDLNLCALAALHKMLLNSPIHARIVRLPEFPAGWQTIRLVIFAGCESPGCWRPFSPHLPGVVVYVALWYLMPEEMPVITGVSIAAIAAVEKDGLKLWRRMRQLKFVRIVLKRSKLRRKFVLIAGIGRKSCRFTIRRSRVRFD